MLGVLLNEEDIINSLNSLGFTYTKENDQYIVNIPNIRVDIEENKEFVYNFNEQRILINPVIISREGLTDYWEACASWLLYRTYKKTI